MNFLSTAKARLNEFEFTPRNIYRWVRHYKNIFFFLTGFLFDAITIDRIDAWSDIAIQISYLLGLTILLIYQYRAHKKTWEPNKWVKRIWPYNVEILHFLYGGLLSAYVILYLKSTSGARALFFLLLLGFLLIVNEMPQAKRLGYRLRLSLYAFCVTSFLIYFVAILAGRIGTEVFIGSLVLSAVLVWFVSMKLVKHEKNPRKEQIRLFVPAGALFLIISLLYFFRLIPPVPLSIQFQGVFHQVFRSEQNYRLRYQKPPLYAFWRNDSQPFFAKSHDSVYYFARVFAPSRFKTKVHVVWELYSEKKKKFLKVDSIPMNIIGGRANGFRGFVSKSNFSPGLWRISTITEDNRTIGYVKFKIKEHPQNKDREWIDIIM